MTRALRFVASIRMERLPRAGLQGAPWAWDDVIAAPPPRDEPKPRAFVVRHGFDDHDADPESRVGFATVVRVLPDELRVEERIAVEPRLLSQVLAVERAVSRRVGATSRAGFDRVARGSDALSRRVGGKGGAAIERGTDAAGKGLDWAGRTVRTAVRATVEAPDRVWAGANAAEAHLTVASERKALLRGFADPGALTREGKAAALFLALASVLVLVLGVTVLIAFQWPDRAAAWGALVGQFTTAGIGTVLLPLFPEFRLFDVASAVGMPGAVLVSALGMTFGAWVALFLGGELHGALRRRSAQGGKLARLLDRAESLASRYGFWTAFIVLAIPLGPDTPIFYLLATARTPVRSYLLGTLLGTLVRFTLYALVAARF